MTTKCTEKGAVLLTVLLLGVLLSVLGGVAINFAMTETEGAQRQVKETSARLLAESGIEQVIAWLNHGQLPGHEQGDVPLVFKGSVAAPDVIYDAGRAGDDRFLNDTTSGVFRTLAELGRIEQIIVYGSSRPEGLCTVQVTSQALGGVRRSASLELGATKIASLDAAVQAGGGTPSDGAMTPRVWAHWGPVRMNGNARLGRSDQVPRKSATASVTGLGYGDGGTFWEDRWVEAYVGGTAQFEDAGSGLPSNVHTNQDPTPGLPADPWQYQKFKELAIKSGSYYVPDRAGRLYRNGVMDPAAAQTPDAVFGNDGLPRGLIFVDTLDQAPPSANNLPTLVMNSPYMEGVFFINAHVVLNPEGQGKAIPALSPPTDGTTNAVSRIPVRISDVTVQGVLHVTGTVYTDKNVRIFGSLSAEGGLTGRGLLEVWYNYDLGRGLVQGLPVVFPLSGTWREWGLTPVVPSLGSQLQRTKR
jgi:hypothetical protein